VLERVDGELLRSDLARRPLARPGSPGRAFSMAGAGRVWLVCLLALACAQARSGSHGGERGMTMTGIRVTVTTDKAAYAVGEPVALTLQVENRSDSAVSFEFATGQRYDFLIVDAAGETVWRWGAGRGFIQMLGAERLEPGASLVYRERFAGELRPGAYSVTGVLPVRSGGLEARSGFDVR